MKNTVTILRERLFSIIRRLVEEPERYARKPGRDFTRKRMLTPDALIYLVLTMDEKSIWKGLLGHFCRRIDTPSASAFVQTVTFCALRFTSASVPGRSFSAFSTWRWQFWQVMPSTPITRRWA